MSSASDVARLASSAAALLQARRFPEAIDAYRALLAQAPDRPDDWFNLAYLLRATRQFEDALAAYAEAIARGVRGAEEAHVNRAVILSDHLFRMDDAEQELLAALAIAPNFLIAWNNLGQLREDRDDRAGARVAYQGALAVAPNDGRAHARLAAIDVFEGDAAGVVARLKSPLSASHNPADLAELTFAMANARDAAGDYAGAFADFQRANALAGQLAPVRYDPAAQDRLIDQIIAAFPVPIEKVDPVAPVPEPLFICGMFRSGSTLCEQLLARHSAITPGGELEIIPALAANALSPYPMAAAALPVERIVELRRAYLGETRALFPTASIVTDKRPDNFLHIGLIKTLFPTARIVHTVRDAVDNILSVFFLHFADSVTYGSRIEDIVHYYRGYRRLMAHWQRLYPDIITVEYEAVVGAPEATLKSLLAALDLDWETGCDPMRAVASDVRTASAWQVRQPIHQRSAGRWRNYAPQIAGLREALART